MKTAVIINGLGNASAPEVIKRVFIIDMQLAVQAAINEHSIIYDDIRDLAVWLRQKQVQSVFLKENADSDISVFLEREGFRVGSVDSLYDNLMLETLIQGDMTA